jgi:hypothetical protein
VTAVLQVEIGSARVEIGKQNTVATGGANWMYVWRPGEKVLVEDINVGFVDLWVIFKAKTR